MPHRRPRAAGPWNVSFPRDLRCWLPCSNSTYLLQFDLRRRRRRRNSACDRSSRAACRRWLRPRNGCLSMDVVTPEIVPHDEAVNVTPASKSGVRNAFEDLVGYLDPGATPVVSRDSWPLWAGEVFARPFACLWAVDSDANSASENLTIILQSRGHYDKTTAKWGSRQYSLTEYSIVVCVIDVLWFTYFGNNLP